MAMVIYRFILFLLISSIFPAGGNSTQHTSLKINHSKANATASEKNIRLGALKVEYEETPLGIDVEKPRFSWQMLSSRKGEFQTGYQIVVNEEKGSLVWNSGKILSDRSLNIEYEGKTLKPSTHYEWTLYVWNHDNRRISTSSWFETGIF